MFRQDNPGGGIVDLQAYCRGFRYVREMLKMLPQQPEPILLAQIFAKPFTGGRDLLKSLKALKALSVGLLSQIDILMNGSQIS